MLNVERQAIIADLVRKKQMVRVTELMEMFSVSDMTIRRDLDALQKKGILKKIYGGAVLNGSDLGGFPEPTILERRSHRLQEKRAIARAALRMIDPGDVIILDAGSTVLELAKIIPSDPEMVIITNSIPIAYELADKPPTLLFIGGQIRKSTHSAVGPKAREFMSDIRARKLFLAASAMSLEQGLMNSNMYESEIKQRMMECSEKVILLADSSKFGIRSYHAFAQWREIDVLVTDEGLPEHVCSELEHQGVHVVRANSAQDAGSNGTTPEPKA